MENEILDLLLRYEAVLAIASKFDTPKVDELVAITSQSLSELRDMLRKPRPVPLSKIRTGLRQRFRELPFLLRRLSKEVPRAKRDELLSAIDAVSDLPAFLREQEDKVRNVLDAGAIRSDDEWYLLRWRLDQIEADHKHQQEVMSLRNLLDAYEGDLRNRT